MRRSLLKGRRAVAFLALGAILCIEGAVAESTTMDEATTYRVGICRLSGEGLSIEYFPFLSAFPELLALKAAPLPLRLEPGSYGLEHTEKKRRAEAVRLGTQVAAKLDAAAAISFDPKLTAVARRDAALLAAEEIRKAREAFGASQQGGDTSQPAPKLRPTEFLTGNLLDLGNGSPKTLARQQNLDLLLYGSVKAIGPYLAVVILGYEANLERQVFSWKGYADPADPQSLAEDFAAQLREWVAGEGYGSVDIVLDPPHALLLVDGTTFSNNGQPFIDYSARLHRFSAWAPGFARQDREIDLKPGDRQSLSIRLSPESSGSAVIGSDPPGALVYLEDRKTGETPATVDLAGMRTVASVEAENYETSYIVLPAQGMAEITVNLRLEDELGPQGRLGQAKDRFYQALGWFVVSLPVTSLSLGTFSLYNEAYSRHLDSSLGASRIAAGIFLGISAVASGGLGINALVRLGDYIDSTR